MVRSHSSIPPSPVDSLALLSYIKATAHNVFVHPNWLYDPKKLEGKLKLNVSIEDGVVVVDHNWDITPIREQILGIYSSEIWKPLLGALKARGWLPSYWREYVRAALFCCPFLVLNLIDGKRYTPEQSILALSKCVELGSKGDKDDTRRNIPQYHCCMKIAIVDYGASNLQSVGNALTSLGHTFEIVAEPEKLAAFDKVIVPGVGAAGSAMKKLRESGFADVFLALTVPVLGLCLGMQLFAEFSEEDDTQGLGIISGKVRRFVTELKVPHMGWNTVRLVRDSKLTGRSARRELLLLRPLILSRERPAIHRRHIDLRGRYDGHRAIQELLRHAIPPRKVGRVGDEDTR